MNRSAGHCAARHGVLAARRGGGGVAAGRRRRRARGDRLADRTPAWGPEVLARHELIDNISKLGWLYEQW
ncbi:MAG TPA: hypothetical protein VGE42_03160, partial [Candidatus Dormibacteraeota bacterium]